MGEPITESDGDFLKNGHKIYLRHLSIDSVIFGFHENELKVLLLKWKDGGPWSLPGGFIKHEESIEQSANRVLEERTGLRDIFLKQFHVFSDPAREKGKSTFRLVETGGWMMDRFLTVGFYALVEFSQVTPRPDLFSSECRWWDVNEVPPMVYDHNEIFDKALQVLRASLNDTPIGYELLPARFTMPELQKLYETILGKKLDRRNFHKKMLALGILDRLKERKTGGAHKAPYLYKFNKVKYERALKSGFRGFGW